VSNARRLGRELGRNGVWGNVGAATASGATALLAAEFGWRAAFAVPGAVTVGLGVAFLAAVPGERGGSGRPASEATAIVRVANPVAIAGLYLMAVVAGGITFTVTTVALPKIVDERLGFALQLDAIGWITTAVFFLGALTQLAMGRLLDRVELPKLFVGLSVLQPIGLGIAAANEGLLMLAGIVLVMAAIYGQVVINDAMIARYVAPHLRAKAFGVRYFLGFAVSGLAVPAIGVLHGWAGFPAVLGATAVVGGIVFASALGFLGLARRPAEAVIPARAA
jgi:MFS family permease